MRKRGVNGFTLIEILLVIAILMGLVVVEMRRQLATNDEQVSVSAGRQIEELGRALDRFIGLRMSGLQAGTDPNCVAVAANVCEVPIQVLRNLGFLPPSANAPGNAAEPVRAPWDSAYVMRVRRIIPPLPAQAALVCAASTGAQTIGCPVPYPGGAVPSHQNSIQGLVISQAAWNDGPGTVIKWGNLGRMAREIGPSSGVSQAGLLVGYNGGWTIATNDFGAGLITDGQSAYMTNAQAGLWTQFVRRDGSLPMMGDLNMGGQRMMNVNDMFINGPITNRRNKNLSSMAPNWVFKGVYGVSEGESVPKPTCASLVAGGAPGVPQMKLLLQNLAPGPESQGSWLNAGNNAAVTAGFTDQPTADASIAPYKAQSAWYIYSDDNPTDWTAHFQRRFDVDPVTGTQTIYPGSGLAEVYCNYGDQ